MSGMQLADAVLQQQHAGTGNLAGQMDDANSTLLTLLCTAAEAGSATVPRLACRCPTQIMRRETTRYGEPQCTAAASAWTGQLATAWLAPQPGLPK